MTPKPRLVEVRWNDAHGSAIAQVTMTDLPHRPYVMTSVGWLLKDDEVGVSIANESYVEDGETYYRGHTFIPAGMVVRPIVEVTRKPKSGRTSSRSARKSPASEQQDSSSQPLVPKPEPE